MSGSDTPCRFVILRHMKIAQVAPLAESVPPKLYGGTERVVSYLTEELVRQGHSVTLFASGDSRTAAELHACAETALRFNEHIQDPHVFNLLQFDEVRERADPPSQVEPRVAPDRRVVLADDDDGEPADDREEKGDAAEQPGLAGQRRASVVERARARVAAAQSADEQQVRDREEQPEGRGEAVAGRGLRLDRRRDWVLHGAHHNVQ